MLRVTQSVNDLIRKAVAHRTYHIIKQLARYEDVVAYKIHRMANKTTVEMMDKMFSGKENISVVGFLQDFKLACNARVIHEGGPDLAVQTIPHGAHQSSSLISRRIVQLCQYQTRRHPENILQGVSGPFTTVSI